MVKLYGLPWTIMSVVVPAALYAWLGVLVGYATQVLPPAGVIWVSIPLCLVAIRGFFELCRAIRKSGDLRLQKIHSRKAQPPENVYIEFPNGERLPLETKFEHYDPGSGQYVWEVEVTPKLAVMLSTEEARIDCENLPAKTVLHIHAHDDMPFTNT